MPAVPPLSAASRDFLELLASIYLQNRRAAQAAALLELLIVTDACEGRTYGALALAQLRSAHPDKALKTLSAAPMPSPLSPAFQLLRAQTLSALQRPDEAAAAMRAFVAARRLPLAQR